MKNGNNFQRFQKLFNNCILFIFLCILVKTWNGEKSFVDRETEQDKNNAVKRSFNDDYNEDFDRGVVSIFIVISSKF